MASSRIEMDDYENATKLEEDQEIYEEIETANEDIKKDPVLKCQTAHGNIKDTVLKIETAHGNIKKDPVLNLSLKKWLQFVLLPLLIVSFLSISIILTVAYFSLYAELEAKMEKKYSFLMTKKNLSLTEIHAVKNEARDELEHVEFKMEKKYALLMTKQDISAKAINAFADKTRGYDEMLKKGETVGFSAYRTGTQSLSAGTKVLFNHIWTNVGNGYQTSTGIFTAPHEGLYHFTAVVMSIDNVSLFLKMYHNKIATSGSNTIGDGYKTGTFDVVFHLQMGDEVYIASGGTHSIFSNSDKYVTFSGHSIL